MKKNDSWYPYLDRYSNGEWRSLVFREILIDEAANIKKKHGNLSLLDIGCGAGFDGDASLQRSLCQVADQCIGVEPDLDVHVENIFTVIHRSTLEDAPIEWSSIDLAFSVMVLEHIEVPHVFWDKIYNVLKKDGVFWGFTVDARHWFVFASLLAEKLHVKDWYLNKLHGKRAKERYENYGVFYRCNTPQQIQCQTHSFASIVALNFSKVGQMDYYFPRSFWWFSKLIDRISIRMGMPGSIMAVRIQK